ncbi:hypothetical protein M758_UG286100 [Ceratodon purpureus]|nr:hypothetical protein M758_UG286100 [Ceratodon purpureus]
MLCTREVWVWTFPWPRSRSPCFIVAASDIVRRDSDEMEAYKSVGSIKRAEVPVMASSFSECGSCSGGSDSGNLSPSREYTSRSLLAYDQPQTHTGTLLVCIDRIADCSFNLPPSTGLGISGLRTLPQNGLQQDTPSPRWAPELTHHPQSDFGTLPEPGNSQNPGASPFHRRIPHIAPRPAHTAPPAVSNHLEMSPDPGPSLPQTRRRPRSPATREREAMAKRSARNLQREAYSMQRIAHAEGRQISDQGLTHSPSRPMRSTSFSAGLHTPGDDPVKYANMYDTPMCSDWVMDAQTEFGATETYRSHAHSPEVVNSTSLRPGTTSQNYSIPQEKISDSWKEGMESRMDSLQNNLTELLNLFKQGAGNAPRRPVGVVPVVTNPNQTPDIRDNTPLSPYGEPESLTVCAGVTEDPMSQTIQVTTNPPTVPSAVAQDTITLSADPGTQDEHTNSECAPAHASPESSRGTNTFPKGPPHVTETLLNFANTTDALGDGGAICPKTVSAVAITSNLGIQTRGARGRKTAVCLKIPPAFQPAKDSDAIVPAKKSVWIVHPDHGEIVVAAGKTGPGPKSKVMKDGPPCPHGAQWVHVLRVFKHSVKILYPSSTDDRHSLDCALPPKRGRHGLQMWDSKFFIPYKAEESSCTSA